MNNAARASWRRIVGIFARYAWRPEQKKKNVRDKFWLRKSKIKRKARVM
jgi:hypothetical protein